MTPAATVDNIGHYCGRFGPGLFGEPQNSFSNLAFVIGALVAWSVWRGQRGRDPWQVPLFLLAGAIGVGSFVFHSAPSHVTLQLDLLPIQLFGLAFLAYLCRRYLFLSWPTVAAIVIGFFLLRQGWIAMTPRGALGGGISHVPAVLAIGGTGFVLRHRGDPLARHLLASGAVYLLALAVRAWDLALCASFPFGIHWLWHLLTALTASLLIHGIAGRPPGLPVRPPTCR